MQTPSEYMEKTESATRRLFDGISDYLSILTENPLPILVSTISNDLAEVEEFPDWLSTSDEAIKPVDDSIRKFISESFALDTLCGAVLQIAEKAIELNSTNTIIPPDLVAFVNPGKAKFCIGRRIRTVPLGLIIHSGRNQHAHFEDRKFNKPIPEVFERLATEHELQTQIPVRDPSFDLNARYHQSYARNLLDLMEWRDHGKYQQDMHLLLGA